LSIVIYLTTVSILIAVADRIVGTSANAEWDFNADVVTATRGVDFNQINQNIQTALVETFTGSSDIGVYSASVQETLYQMGRVALEKVPAISKVALAMPNIHVIPFALETYGLSNKDHTGSPTIFFPIDEPHGMIRAELIRQPKARL
jgi:urate oxidase